MAWIEETSTGEQLSILLRMAFSLSDDFFGRYALFCYASVMLFWLGVTLAKMRNIGYNAIKAFYIEQFYGRDIAPQRKSEEIFQRGKVIVYAGSSCLQ